MKYFSTFSIFYFFYEIIDFMSCSFLANNQFKSLNTNNINITYQSLVVNKYYSFYMASKYIIYEVFKIAKLYYRLFHFTSLNISWTTNTLYGNWGSHTSSVDICFYLSDGVCKYFLFLVTSFYSGPLPNHFDILHVNTMATCITDNSDILYLVLF